MESSTFSLDFEQANIGTIYDNDGGVDASLRDEFNKILANGGLNVNSWQNLCEVCDVGDGLVHSGRHGMDYHQLIKDILNSVVDAVRREFPQATGEALTARMHNALTQALGSICAEMNTPGSPLREDVAQ